MVHNMSTWDIPDMYARTLGPMALGLGHIYKEFCVGRSKVKTVLYFSYSTARCELCYINWKAFKRFFSALSALDKTIKCYN